MCDKVWQREGSQNWPKIAWRILWTAPFFISSILFLCFSSLFTSFDWCCFCANLVFFYFQTFLTFRFSPFHALFVNFRFFLWSRSACYNLNIWALPFFFFKVSLLLDLSLDHLLAILLCFFKFNQLLQSSSFTIFSIVFDGSNLISNSQIICSITSFSCLLSPSPSKDVILLVSCISSCLARSASSIRSSNLSSLLVIQCHYHHLHRHTLYPQAIS